MAIELPDGWKTINLSEVCDILPGYGFPKDLQGIKSGSFPFYKVGDISKNVKAGNKYLEKCDNYIDELTLRKLKAKPYPPNTIVFAKIGEALKLNRRAIMKTQGIVDNNAVGIKANCKICNDLFLYYFFTTVKLEDYSRATTVPSVRKSDIENITFALPPLNEQFDIGIKLEELFSELDKGIENLKTAQQQLKVYRQAVLKWAFEGKLTNENVKDGEMPEGWKLEQLGNVSDSCLGKMLDRNKNKGTPAPYLRNINVRWNVFNLEDLFEMPFEVKESERYSLKDGDLVICEGGEPGRAAIWKNQMPGLKIQKALHRVRFNKNVVPVFFLYYLNWIASTKRIDQYFTGTTIKHLTGQSLKKILFPLPPIEEQRKITLEIESRFSICDKMEETISTTLQQAEALRQSILKRAFEGKLVKMEKIKQEAVIVSISHQRDDWQRKVLAGWIIFACHKDKYFGRTKFQKTLYLCEQFAQLDFDAHYLKMTAGPLDASFIYPFIKEAETNGWFVEETDTPPYYFEPLIGIGALTKYYPQYFKPVSDKINFIIKLLQGKNTDESELIATIYAIWNNYIIDCKVITSELLTAEVYDWADSKSKFRVPVILSTWQWMKDNGLVPVGFGKLITKSA